jgi:hypothetical protein
MMYFLGTLNLRFEDFTKQFLIKICLKDSFAGPKTFSKYSKNNLYSYNEEGAAPKEFFSTFDVKEAKYLLSAAKRRPTHPSLLPCY